MTNQEEIVCLNIGRAVLGMIQDVVHQANTHGITGYANVQIQFNDFSGHLIITGSEEIFGLFTAAINAAYTVNDKFVEKPGGLSASEAQKKNSPDIV